MNLILAIPHRNGLDLCSMCGRAGREKARVFPLPVSAIPMMSRPLLMIGQHWLWMAVGFRKSFTTLMIFGSVL